MGSPRTIHKELEKHWSDRVLRAAFKETAHDLSELMHIMAACGKEFAETRNPSRDRILAISDLREASSRFTVLAKQLMCVPRVHNADTDLFSNMASVVSSMASAAYDADQSLADRVESCLALDEATKKIMEVVRELAPIEEMKMPEFKDGDGRESLAGSKVLVVDDEPLVRRVMERFLGRLKVDATILETGKLALDMLDKKEFDLAIVDATLPDVQGYEVADAFLTRYPERMVIICTGYAEPGSEYAKGFASGRYTLLMKPFEQNDLVNVLGQGMVMRKKAAP